MSEWKAARVGDICKAANGRAFKPTEWDTEGAPIIRIQNLKNDSAPFNYFRGAIEPRFRVQHGDLLFAWSGTPGTSFGAHLWRGGDAVLNQHIFNLHFDRKRIDERFFCYALNRNVADYVAKAQGGVGLAHITKGKFEDSFIPLPDIDEQRAVVAELEKQFSRLDEAVAGLRRVKANLKRYKAAVLKSAVTGRLVPTEADLARRDGRNYETGAQLLQRILETRRRQWQGKGKYKEPAALDTTDLPGLPEGWVWATVQQLATVQLGKMLDKQKHIAGKPYRYLRNINVRWGSFDLTDLLEMNFEDDELRRFEILDGDVLVCEGGEPARAAVWRKGDTDLKYQKALHRVRFDSGYVPELLVVVLEHMAKSGKLDHLYGGSTIKHFTREVFVTLLLPLPPLSEQHRIVAEVDRLLSIAREAEAEVDANLKRAQGLRQACLSSAFQSETK